MVSRRIEGGKCDGAVRRGGRGRERKEKEENREQSKRSERRRWKREKIEQKSNREGERGRKVERGGGGGEPERPGGCRGVIDRTGGRYETRRRRRGCPGFLKCRTILHLHRYHHHHRLHHHRLTAAAAAAAAAAPAAAAPAPAASSSSSTSTATSMEVARLAISRARDRLPIAHTEGAGRPWDWSSDRVWSVGCSVIARLFSVYTHAIGSRGQVSILFFFSPFSPVVSCFPDVAANFTNVRSNRRRRDS